MLASLSSLFKKNNKFMQNYSVDLHSHLIPGIDDGSKSMNESIELILGLKALGFTKLITTPHIMRHRYANTSEIILSRLDDVREELKRQEIDIELEAASEYYLDEHLLELINKRDILTFGENYLLFEMSYTLKPLNLESVIYEMKVAGYQPVLAHPERYFFMHEDFSIYKRLKEQGLLFQVNLNSFGGYYSKPVQKVAHALMEKGWIDFLGSDTHKSSHLEHFRKNLNSKILKKIFEKNTILNNQLI
ncbi:MAG: CpsB/CapC family capsule biosynthesis tyrosine phosphatase [Campylobacterota bacterium]|nr:CpsB/CapC family capsule biosynthesis tyrosine phosphatase [Campylobacterota bacterium]